MAVQTYKAKNIGDVNLLKYRGVSAWWATHDVRFGDAKLQTEANRERLWQPIVRSFIVRMKKEEAIEEKTDGRM